MGLVAVDQSFMDFFVWGFIALIMAILVIVLLLVVREKWRTPQESKTIRSAYNQKKAIGLLAGDDGISDIDIWHKIKHEGAAETKPKGKPKTHYTGFFSRASQITSVDCAKDKDPVVTGQIAQYISNLNSQKTMLRGARLPINVAYRGKAIVANILGLASLGILDKLEQYNSLDGEEAKAKSEEIVNYFKEAFVKVDVAALKTLFSLSWNTSQINAQEEDKFTEGLLEGKKNQTNPITYILLAMGFCFGCGILLVVATKLL